MDRPGFGSVTEDVRPCRPRKRMGDTVEGRPDDGRRGGRVVAVGNHRPRGKDVEGNAGWKLSNSPWNLQVISKSPGSLTRFMPDEVPGVTSPMVYIAMLFSWFAWHVEDHELHSLNFLHMGAPKTWYAVPESHASRLEEVVRLHGYGSHVDRLDAFILLGEKRTLLSPEILVSSGIPCCRLVQNPGEFVVTFPRAYHVGFSHGFNCGEAANFATPKWLDVAKEAAVRRAAMNYLPMLSHQQLLYFLAMSFISRIPREFLPGARSSRLRDRQKEEREFAVKKAFLEDIMYEQRLLNIVLKRKSTFRAVLWNTGMLPFLNDGHPLPYRKPSTPSSEQAVRVHKAELDFVDDKGPHQVMEKVSYTQDIVGRLHEGDDALPCGLDIDSGALSCAACGILGYPFMSILQPSHTAMEAFLAMDLETIDQKHESMKLKDHPQSFRGSTTKVNSDNETIKDHLIGPNARVKDGCTEADTNDNINCKWNFSDCKMRPRTFCLKHGILVEEKLQSFGGAYLLVICHSDYLKIKSQALAIEDSSTQFHFDDIQMENASKEDLDLISISIDDGPCEDYEDWTAKMGFNLRHFVKCRKERSTNQIKTCFSLDELLSDVPPLFGPGLRWNGRRSRTPYRCTASQGSRFNSGPICKMNEATRNRSSGSRGNTQDGVQGRCTSSSIQQGFSAKESPQLHDGRGVTLAANCFESGDGDANLSGCITCDQDAAIHQIDDTVPNLPTATDKKTSRDREASTLGGRPCKAGESVQDEHTIRNDAHGHKNFGQHEIKENMTSSLEDGSGDAIVGEFLQFPKHSVMDDTVCQSNGPSIDQVDSNKKTNANQEFLSIRESFCDVHHDAGHTDGTCTQSQSAHDDIVIGGSDSISVIDGDKMLQEHQNDRVSRDLKRVPFRKFPIDIKTPDSMDLGDLPSKVASSSCKDFSASDQMVSDTNIPENIALERCHRIDLPVKCYHRRKKIKTKDIVSNKSCTANVSSAHVGDFDIVSGDDQQLNVEQNPPHCRKKGVQRKRELNHLSCSSQYNFGSFARGPCEGLRARSAKSSSFEVKRNKKSDSSGVDRRKLTRKKVSGKSDAPKKSDHSMSSECGLDGPLMK